jgi:hypothetical protein
MSSCLIQAGVPQTVIQRHLGRESIQTTSDRYAIWTVSRHGWWPMWSATLSSRERLIRSRRMRPVRDSYSRLRLIAGFFS